MITPYSWTLKYIFLWDIIACARAILWSESAGVVTAITIMSSCCLLLFINMQKILAESYLLVAWVLGNQCMKTSTLGSSLSLVIYLTKNYFEWVSDVQFTIMFITLWIFWGHFPNSGTNCSSGISCMPLTRDFKFTSEDQALSRSLGFEKTRKKWRWRCWRTMPFRNAGCVKRFPENPWWPNPRLPKIA